MHNNKKTCLLTGASGSIGIHTLSQIMKNTDWDVVCLVSFTHKGLADRLAEHFEGHPEDRHRVRVINHDLVAPLSELTIRKIGKVDYIINMASLSDVEDSIVNPVPFVQNNVALVLNMLEYARIAKPEVFVQISTDEVYGPTDGKHKGYVEWDAQIPSNPYAASKAAQEAIAISYWRAYGVPLVITNTMNNYGEMQSASKFPVMIQKKVEAGEEVVIHGNEKGEIGSRSYIHSQNFANAVLYIIENLKPHLHVPGTVDRPDRYHIAGEIQLDNLELAKLIAKLMGKELRYKVVNFHSARPGHDPHYGLNDDKIKALGWKPPVSFEESLGNVIRWQTEHNEWIK